nr:hypothetical protein [Kutzneria buriramensis]WKX15531.1 hypothetical protein Q4V64_51740 [Kutzneria buriramensis]
MPGCSRTANSAPSFDVNDSPHDVNDSLDLALARKALAAQPFSVLLGTRLVAFGDGAATLELDIRDELRQQYGFVHGGVLGGVLGYAAGNALTFAAGSASAPG